MDITGSFETHITLGARDLERVLEYARDHGLKVTHIVLGEGKYPSQPMLTRHASGKLSKVLAETHSTANRLKGLGVETLRVKVETSIENPIVPEDERQASAMPEVWHFEHHVKLLLEDTSDLDLVGGIAESHSARLSRNALRELGQGRQERFLTQRFYHAGKSSAQRALDALVDELHRNHISILETEAEYVVYDSNVALDSGWMPTPHVS